MPSQTTWDPTGSPIKDAHIAGRGADQGDHHLPQLPAEMVEMFATYMDVDSLFNFRLTCKTIEEKTFRHFAKTYYKTKGFMISRYALQALLAMSKSRMAPHIMDLTLGPASNDQGPCMTSDMDTKGRGVCKGVDSIAATLMTYSRDNAKMRMYGEDAMMITEAFKGLRNVKNLTIMEYGYAYGQHYLEKTLGKGKMFFRPEKLDAMQALPRIFNIAMHAAQAAQLSVESVTFYVEAFADDSKMRDGCTRVSLDCFPTFNPESSNDTFAFSKLRELRFTVAHPGDLTDPVRATDLAERLVAFLRHTPTLKILDIVFASFDSSTARFLGVVAKSKSLEKLQQLELGNLTSCWNQMRDLLSSTKNLEHLLLDDILIPCKGWLHMLSWIRDHMKSLHTLQIYPVEYAGPKLEFDLHEESSIEAWYDTTMEKLADYDVDGCEDGMHDEDVGSGDWSESEPASEDSDEDMPDLMSA